MTTDAQFNGICTKACIGHIGPEALSSGPLGKVIEVRSIQIIIDRNSLKGGVDCIREAGCSHEQRSARGCSTTAPCIPAPHLALILPNATRLWVALRAGKRASRR